MTAHKPYAAMKDSGVEWLGNVPTHWSIQRLATLYRETSREGNHSLPVLSISIHNGISDEELSSEDRERQVRHIEDRTKYKRVRPNDLAYNMMRAWQGAFGAVQVEGLVSPAYVVAEPTREMHSAYMEHLLRTPMAIEEMWRYSRGIADFRLRLYWEEFRDIRVCVPPSSEQQTILTALERETARIDKLIKRKTRFIELLAEKRRALITHAVTKGLNPKVEMNDSGVEWLGEVPKHWRVGRLKHLGRLKGGSGFPPHLQRRPDNEMPFYKVGDLGKSPDGCHLGDTDNTITLEETKEIGATVFPLNTITWAKIGAALMLNRRRILRTPACLDNNMTGFTIDDSVVMLSFAFYLTSVIDFTVHAKPGAVPSFSEGDQGELDVPIPSIEEQSQIAKYLDTQTLRIDALIAKTERSIELLREHRTALITAAVTGKIDLRESA